LFRDGCDQHCVASQAFVRSTMLPKRRENRPEIGLFAYSIPSLYSQFSDLKGEIAESLQRIFEIFLFLGDGERRPGSIHTA